MGDHVGALKLGIENLAAHPVQGRGVMIDLEAHCGRGEEFVGYDRLMRIMEVDKVEVEEGDLLCFRTGYDRVILDGNKNPDPAVLAANPGAGLDGRDERLLNWITKSGVVALISDNRAVEQMPSRPCEGEDLCASLPLHAHCLFKLGVYLGEIWLLSDLADWLRAHKRSRFLLTAPPLRLPGAVGSPANAVATV
jgi:kynurenine formamidase